MAPRSTPLDVEPLVDSVLHASRALVAVAARSLAAVADEVTLPQYRVLVVLAARGPQGLAPLAAALGVSPSTATRMCGRLVRKGLVQRRTPSRDRRQVRLALTEAGRAVVAQVTALRRGEIARIVAAVPPERRAQVVDALSAFAEAAGESADRDWTAGWEL
ncbi:MAG TPA: MarR family transcriptional regulator [Acidimicrobiales bacterium]|nr:MarR family transcriptional regulator [Acidimicrobiales bacterium]